MYPSFYATGHKNRARGASGSRAGILRRLLLALLLSISSVTTAPASSWNNEPAFITWMRWMALWLGMDPGYGSMGLPYWQGANSLNAMTPGLMGSGFGGPYPNWNQWSNRQGGQPWQVPDQASTANPLIDGVWRGPDKLTLIIKGDRMRLSIPGGTPVSGELIVRGKYFIVYRPTADALEVYEFLLQGNRLWLVDGNTSRQFERYVGGTR